MKKHFSGIYKNAVEITPEHLLEFYLAGDQQERREAGAEILRRLCLYETMHEEVTCIVLRYVQDTIMSQARGLEKNKPDLCEELRHARDIIQHVQSRLNPK